LSIGVIVSTIALCCGSFNISTFILKQTEIGWFVLYFFPLFLIFFVCVVAETNRHPFDLPEAEAELVSGYNVEYAAMGFALFSLGEYANILKMSAFVTILFFGGWSMPFLNIESNIFCSFFFALKIAFFVVIFILLRAGLPRYRYDQLMKLGWKTFLIPAVSFYVLIYVSLWCFDGLPL